MEFNTEFIEKVEKDYLDILIDILKRNEISVEDAKQATREFLELTPFESQQDMEAKIEKFTMEHPIFGRLYIDLLKFEGHNNDQEMLAAMRHHLKNNDLDKAINIVQSEV